MAVSKRARRMLIGILGAVVAVYVGLCVLVLAFQSRLVYFPFGGIDATPEAVGLAYEEVELEAEDGVRLAAWFVPAEHSRGVVLFCHGNAGNRSHRLDTLYIFRQLGFSTLIFDYRGYGGSGGRPSERGTCLDAEAAWRHLVEAKGIAPREIVVHGRSLGGAVAAWLAQRHTPAALVLESTFTSVPDMGARLYPFLPVRLLARIRYPTLERLPELRCPILVVHSREDDIVPFAHGRRLFEAAREPKDFLEIQGGHNEGFALSGSHYTDGLNAFLSRHVGRQPGPAPGSP